MSELGTIISDLETVLAKTKEELAIFETGKKSSAPILRKYAQDSKTLWQNFRIKTMAQLKTMPTKKRTPKTTEAVI